MANTNVTISKLKVSIMGIEQRIVGFTHGFHVDYTDVNTGAGSSDTVTLALGTTPAFWLADAALANVTTAFAGTTAFTVTVGTTTNVACLQASASVLTAGIVNNTSGPFVVATTTQSFGTAAIGLVAVFTNATGGSPSALSAGAMDIYLSIINTAQLTSSTTG